MREAAALGGKKYNNDEKTKDGRARCWVSREEMNSVVLPLLRKAHDGVPADAKTGPEWG